MMKSSSQLVFVQLNNKLMDLLISPKTTLPWLVMATGAGGWVLPLLAPLREAGSMLPQWWIKNSQLGKQRRRDIGWRIGIGIQLIGALLLTLMSFWMAGNQLAIAIALTLAILSIGRAFTSVFSKDIQATLVGKGKRGKFIGNIASISGALSILFALVIIFLGGSSQLFYIQLGFAISTSLALAVLACSLGLRVKLDTATNYKSDSIWATFKASRLLRKLVLMRCLMLHAMLAIPILVSSWSESQGLNIGWLLLASGIAALSSSWVWGRLADNDAVKTLKFAGLICFLSILGGIFLVGSDLYVLKPICFIALLVGYDGIRVGRKTLTLNVTNDENRLGIVGAGNTAVGVFLLVSGAFYGAVFGLWQQATLWIMLCMLLLGIGYLWHFDKGNPS